VNETGCTFDPVFKPSDACKECVSNAFQGIYIFFASGSLLLNAVLCAEKLYEIEHPRLTKHFEEISNVPDDGFGYWISKKWCKGRVGP